MSNSFPGLSGNPHADALKLHQDFGNTMSPSVQATLALAYEQRTANLIAELSMQALMDQQGIVLSDATVDTLNARLGLDGDDA